MRDRVPRRREQGRGLRERAPYNRAASRRVGAKEESLAEFASSAMFGVEQIESQNGFHPTVAYHLATRVGCGRRALPSWIR